jgi:chorismate synthase
MASNSYGDIFQITTWGESHGKAVGVVIDGCPSGLKIDHDHIKRQLMYRRPGQSKFVTPRAEQDVYEILSGIYDGVTTGTPISVMFMNKDVRSKDYSQFENTFKPGHADYTYYKKYGMFDHRGSGRASARETVCRVFSGALAAQLLADLDIKIKVGIRQIGDIRATYNVKDVTQETIYKSSIRCPDDDTELKMRDYLEQLINEGDSSGALVEVVIENLPVGLGEPIYNKITASLSHAIMSIPGVKGISFGSGFACVSAIGSKHNDQMQMIENRVGWMGNNAGGMLGGITTGQDVIIQVAFKPTSSIKKDQHTINRSGSNTLVKQKKTSRHDPCIAIRGVSVVESMTYLSILNLYLSSQFVYKKKNNIDFHARSNN